MRRFRCRRTAPRTAGRRARARGTARPSPTGTRPSCRSRRRAGRRALARGCARGRESRAARRSAGRTAPERVYLCPSSLSTRSSDAYISSAPCFITGSSYATESSPVRSRSLTSLATISSWTSRSSSTIVEHRFNVVAVRVEHERGVVALVVTPVARPAVVAVASLDGDSVELLDLVPVPGRERDVHVLAQRLLVLGDRKVAPVGGALLLVRPRRRVPERRKHGLVERLRRVEVGDA